MNFEGEQFRSYAAHHSGVEINPDIFDSDMMKLTIGALKGNIDDLSEADREYAQNFLTWYNARQSSEYAAPDSEFKRILLNTASIQAIKAKKFENTTLFNNIVEYAFLDLLKVLLGKAGIRVFKTSMIDDVHCGLDYLLVGEHGTYGIDLTLSGSADILSAKEAKIAGRKIPTEFNLFNKKSGKITKSGRVYINDPISVQGIVLPMEPHLIQAFVYNYMDLLIVQDAGHEQVDTELVNSAWEVTVEQYQSGEIKPIETGIYQGTDPDMNLSVIKQAQLDILDNLSQDNEGNR